MHTINRNIKIKPKIKEIVETQDHILKAIKHLNERLEALVNRRSNYNPEDVRNILQSQEMIDAIVVKNSDDILILRKIKK